jgi:carboxypeptidase D
MRAIIKIRNKYVISYLLILQLISTIVSAKSSVYEEIFINNVSRQQLVALAQQGVIIDHVCQNNATIYIQVEKMSILENMGLHYNVRPMNRDQKRLDNYPSVDQINNMLQSFENNYPDLCQLYFIGKSYEGRPLYFIKISDHASLEEDEPEVKYISSMHGDEPVGAILCLNLIRYLLQNYHKIDSVTNLIDNLEIWIMPLMNPDGYVHQKRFNMQGIDLNRNFPDRVMDNHNTPKGRAVEVQHVMNWEFDHSSVLSVNFHTGVVVVNYPYDSDFDPLSNYSPTPDHKLFQSMALSYANLNPSMKNSTVFDSGITNGVEWYMVYGGMQDWSYVWMGCMELTIELYQTKWPAYSKISQIWDNNRDAMLHYFTWAQKGIRGVVTDLMTQKPVHACIQVDHKDFKVYTDPDVGDYHRILLPGNYNVTISADGYVTKYVPNIQVMDGYASRQDIELMPVLDISLLDIIEMLKVLSAISVPGEAKYYDINSDHQLGLSDVIWALRLIAYG